MSNTGIMYLSSSDDERDNLSTRPDSTTMSKKQSKRSVPTQVSEKRMRLDSLTPRLSNGSNFNRGSFAALKDASSQFSSIPREAEVISISDDEDEFGTSRRPTAASSIIGINGMNGTNGTGGTNSTTGTNNVNTPTTNNRAYPVDYINSVSGSSNGSAYFDGNRANASESAPGARIAPIDVENLAEKLQNHGATQAEQQPSTDLVEIRDSDEDPVVDSDEDDLVILDRAASDVTFKPTSFESSHNRPAPVYHANNPTMDRHIVINQLQQRISQYSAEINMLSSQDPMLRSELEKNRIDSANIAETIQTLLFQTSGLDPAVHGTLIDQVRRIVADKEASYHQLKQKEMHLHGILQGNMQRAARFQHSIDTSKSMLNSMGMNYDQLTSNSVLIHNYSQDYRQVNPSYTQIAPGYTPNIYSQPQQQRSEHHDDLQDLIDNIQPDDEEEEGLEPTPPELSITLMKHQRVGLTWLKRMENAKSKGGILADDMGLGKTVQAIALFMAHRSTDEECKTNLIIAPVSLLRQWAAELESKLKSGVECKVGIYHSHDKKMLNTFSKISKYDVILTSYGTLSSEWKRHFKESILRAKASNTPNANAPRFEDGGKSYVSPFFSKTSTFYRIILDEAQNIKNKAALASKAVTYLKSIYRFCLSGTPIQNNVDELFPIIRFLQIRPYNDEFKFRAEISLPLKSNSGNYDDSDKSTSIRKLRAILMAILLRRSKTSLIDGKPILSLPEKHIISDYVEMHEGEKEFYGGLEAGIQKKAKDLMQNSKSNGGSGAGSGHAISSILTLLLRLRQACCHQYLVEIGEMKQPGKVGQSKDWQNMYNQLKKFPSEVITTIKNTEQYTCPICYNINDDTLVIFPGCGHMICQACTDSFVQDNSVDEYSSVVSCVECKSEFKRKDIIDYEIFEKVFIDGMDFDELSVFCRDYYATTTKTKTTNAMLLNQILEREPFKPSAKLAKCFEMIQEIFVKYPNEKIIIFSQFTTLFDIMKLGLDEREIPFLRYDGTMSLDQKNATITKFYQQDEVKVLLLSLRAGNSGLTLTCASHVIIMDPFWNPFVEEQAMDRAHRIGQEREVYVHKILITDTVETRIMELQDRKKEMVGTALDENGLKSVSKLGQRELGFLFGINSLN